MECREIERLELLRNKLTSESSELRRNCESNSNELRRKQNQKNSAERNLREIESDIAELSRGNSDRISLYGGAPLAQVYMYLSALNECSY